MLKPSNCINGRQKRTVSSPETPQNKNEIVCSPLLPNHWTSQQTCPGHLTIKANFLVAPMQGWSGHVHHTENQLKKDMNSKNEQHLQMPFLEGISAWIKNKWLSSRLLNLISIPLSGDAAIGTSKKKDVDWSTIVNQQSPKSKKLLWKPPSCRVWVNWCWGQTYGSKINLCCQQKLGLGHRQRHFGNHHQFWIWSTWYLFLTAID